MLCLAGHARRCDSAFPTNSKTAHSQTASRTTTRQSAGSHSCSRTWRRPDHPRPGPAAFPCRRNERRRRGCRGIVGGSASGSTVDCSFMTDGCWFLTNCSYCVKCRGPVVGFLYCFAGLSARRSMWRIGLGSSYMHNRHFVLTVVDIMKYKCSRYDISEECKVAIFKTKLWDILYLKQS